MMGNDVLLDVELVANTSDDLSLNVRRRNIWETDSFDISDKNAGRIVCIVGSIIVASVDCVPR